MLTLAILIALILGILLFSAVSLWLGARLVGVSNVSYLRALGATFILIVVLLPLNIAFLRLGPDWFKSPLAAILIETGVDVLLSWLILRATLRTSLWRAIGSWLGLVVGGAGVLAFLLFVLQPYVLGFYVAPSHGMAPTILGPHQRGTCPHCGQTSTVSFVEGVDDRREDGGERDPFNLRPEPAPQRERLGICPSCAKAGLTTKIEKTVYGGDRFVMNRLLAPRRWDLVVFRYPPEPDRLYAKRLIGLPGEEVVIKEGGIWINGARAEPPADIANLVYGTRAHPRLDEDDPNMLGSPQKPAKLTPDEYFVLGDFSLASSDSRIWGPVPRANLEGVVTLIYWPPARWRILR